MILRSVTARRTPPPALCLLGLLVGALGCSASDASRARSDFPGAEDLVDSNADDPPPAAGQGGVIEPPPPVLPDPMSVVDEPLGSDNACGQGSVSAELTPVNMLIMFDRSGSMEDDNKWPSATRALTTFLQYPGAEGLRVALRFFPHDDPAAGCTEGACNVQACAQPLVEIGDLSREPAPVDAHEARLVQAIASANPGGGGGRRGGGGGGGGQGTPISAALGGALQWASAHKAAFPDENTVVIFVTDGEPNGCDEDFNNISALAADALSTSGVSTYAIGLLGSSEAQMDQLAQAGGTGQGIFIGNSQSAEQDLLDALNGIRGETLSCDFPVPSATDGDMEIDLAKINVTYTAGANLAATAGANLAATFPKAESQGACGSDHAWYYDDPGAPTRITLCPSACDTVRNDPGAQIDILIGCATCGGLDVICGDQTPPGVPPIF